MLIELCNQENHLRETPYSSIFATSATLNGLSGEWQIERFSFPLDPAKREALRMKYNLSIEETNLFSLSFRENLRMQLSVFKQFSGCTNHPALIPDNVLVERKEYSGAEVYFIAMPYMTPLMKCSFIKGGYIEARTIATVGFRLLSGAMELDQLGLHLGPVSVENIGMVHIRDQQLLRYGSFLYSSRASKITPHYPFSPLTADDEIRGGKMENSLSSDTRSIFRLLTALACGSPKYLGHRPEAAPAGLAPILKKGIQESPDPSSLCRMLLHYIKEEKDAGDTEIELYVAT